VSAQRGVDVAKVAALEGAECDDCGMPDHACECYMFDRDDDALDDDFCECGVWPCSCADSWDDEWDEEWDRDWRYDYAEADDDAYWRGELRAQLRDRSCGSCGRNHDTYVCFAWRDGDVHLARAFLPPDERGHIREESCPDCRNLWPWCSCAGEPLTAPALEEDAPRPWEALRRQLDAIEAERRGRP